MSKRKNGAEEEGLSPYNSILPQDPKDAKIMQNAPRSTSPVAEQYQQRGTQKEVTPLKNREYRTTPRTISQLERPAEPRAIQGTSELDDES